MNGKETLGNYKLGESSVGRERDGSVDIADRQETVGNNWAPLGGSRTEAWTSQTDRLRRAPLGGSEGAIY